LKFYWLIENEVAGHSAPMGEADLKRLYDQGVRALVRMATHPAISSTQVQEFGMADLHEPVQDGTAPSQKQLEQMVDFMLESVFEHKPVGVSCTAGQGRTGTVLACYLAKRNLSAKGLVIEVRKHEPMAVEEPEQWKAIKEYLSRLMAPTESEQSSKDWVKSLKTIAEDREEREYGRGYEHANAVKDMALAIHKQLMGLSLFPQSSDDRRLLEAAGYLHDVGVGIDQDDTHHIDGFNWLKERLENAKNIALPSAEELAIILYCVLWHKGDDFNLRPEVELQDVECAKRLAAVLRVADGLCWPGGRPVNTASVLFEEPLLIIEACPSKKGDRLTKQIGKAKEKQNLLEEVLREKKVRGVQVKKCSHPTC